MTRKCIVHVQDVEVAYALAAYGVLLAINMELRGLETEQDFLNVIKYKSSSPPHLFHLVV